MNGELAEVVALIAHGNAWLAGATSNATDIAAFEATNSTFQYVRSVSFEINQRRHKTHYVQSVADWLAHLSEIRIERLSLTVGKSAPVAFANQGSWGILGHNPRRTYAWFGHWTVNHSGTDPNQRQPIWEVTYRVMSRRGAAPPHTVALAPCAQALRDALHEAIEFARNDSFLVTFIPWFEEALVVGASHDPEIAWHPDSSPRMGMASKHAN